MGTDGAIDIRKAFGNGEHLAVSFHPSRDGYHAGDPGCARARTQGVELAGEIWKIEMTVAIDQHQACALASLST
jgi:hypothetical protein